MPISDWFTKQKPQEPDNPELKRAVPDGVWEQCKGCNEPLFVKEWERNLRVCPKCEHHSPMSAQERINCLTDPNTFEELWKDICAEDPISFNAVGSYPDKLKSAKEKTGLRDAIICGRAHV